MEIYFWADGSWCKHDQLTEYLFSYSDNFGTVNVPADFDDEAIDEVVAAEIKEHEKKLNAQHLETVKYIASVSTDLNNEAVDEAMDARHLKAVKYIAEQEAKRNK